MLFLQKNKTRSKINKGSKGPLIKINKGSKGPLIKSLFCIIYIYIYIYIFNQITINSESNKIQGILLVKLEYAKNI